MNLIRTATAQELENYNKVEALTADMDMEKFEDMIEKLGDFVFSYRPEEHKRAYNKVYRLAKKLNTSVAVLVDWYCIN